MMALTLDNPQTQLRREGGEQVVEQAVEQAVEEGVEECVEEGVEQAVEEVAEVVGVQRRRTLKLSPRLAGPVFQWWWLRPHASLELKSLMIRPRHPVRLSVQRHRKISS
jgi:hypothetical protein